MNAMNHNAEGSTLQAHAFALAETHSEGLEKRCRRWRRRCAAKRAIVMALLLLAILFLAGGIGTAVAQQTYATGWHSTDESVATVRQMLQNQ